MLTRPEGKTPQDQLLIDQIYDENKRVQHLITILLQHMSSNEAQFPLKYIDRQMKLFDEAYNL
jgi:hypothetical protein